MRFEKDYDVLKLKYNALMVDYESMLDEKEKLKEEVWLIIVACLEVAMGR